jgi:hypothetical protein
MAEPILLELQQREQENRDYLSRAMLARILQATNKH